MTSERLRSSEGGQIVRFGVPSDGPLRTSVSKSKNEGLRIVESYGSLKRCNLNVSAASAIPHNPNEVTT